MCNWNSLKNHFCILGFTMIFFRIIWPITMFAPDSLPLKIIRKIPLCLSFGLIIIKYYNWSRIYALRNLHEKFILRRHTFVLTLFEILKCDIFTFVCESVHCSESMKKLFGKVCNGICSNIRVRLKILIEGSYCC